MFAPLHLSRFGIALAVCAAVAGGPSEAEDRVPVILDTDIGDDIDDTWALILALKSPKLDIRLVATDFGNAIYRSRLTAKILEACGRTDIPIAVGLNPEDRPGRQSDWLGDYQLDDYPGIVHMDGVGAIIDTIKNSSKLVTLLCIGPVPNIAAALERDPSIVTNARFIGMHGSIRTGYDESPTPSAEWNVLSDPSALRKVFAADWDCTITPLDTCGLIKLSGERYQRLLEADDVFTTVLIENYRSWLPHAAYLNPRPNPRIESSTLFDTLAVYLAFDDSLVEIERLPIRVTDQGRTVVDATAGRLVNCATSWKDSESFHNYLADTLAGRRVLRVE